MDLHDVIVEVRDRNLDRVGQISSRDLRLEIGPVSNNVGSWSVSLPTDHPLSDLLRQPGSGIIVTSPDDVLISGPTTSPESIVSQSDSAGTVTFSGVCDNIVLWDRLAYPDPTTADTRHQGSDYDTRNAPAETLLHDYVAANLGPLAPVERRIPTLVMGDNGAHGATLKKQARFDVIGDLLASIAGQAGLCFRVVQRGNVLAFETREVADLTKQVRLDVRNSTLAGHRVAVAAPTATKAIVGTQDASLDRLWATVTTPDADKAEADWGRRIERFVDQSYTPDEAVWTQSAVEMLAAEGLATVTAQATPITGEAMRFGRDWSLGDRVAIVIEGQEVTSIVTGIVVRADADTGFQIGAVLGDGTGFSPDLGTRKRIMSVESRVSSLERNNTAGTVTDSNLSTVFSFGTASTTWTCPHNFGRTGVSVVCYDASGAEQIGDVEYTDANTVTVRWYFPTTGSCRITK